MSLWIETLQKRQKIKENWMSPNKDLFIDIESLLLIVFGMGIDFFHIFHILADFWARSWVVSLKFCFSQKLLSKIFLVQISNFPKSSWGRLGHQIISFSYLWVGKSSYEYSLGLAKPGQFLIFDFFQKITICQKVPIKRWVQLKLDDQLTHLSTHTDRQTNRQNFKQNKD